MLRMSQCVNVSASNFSISTCPSAPLSQRPVTHCSNLRTTQPLNAPSSQPSVSQCCNILITQQFIVATSQSTNLPASQCHNVLGPLSNTNIHIVAVINGRISRAPSFPMRQCRSPPISQSQNPSVRSPAPIRIFQFRIVPITECLNEVS